MFISEQICFVEFGKTGCSFIREVFNENIKSGRLTKIHDQITNDLIYSERIKVGSIRNPLDWYISLWSFGCLMKKKDPLYSNLTTLRLNPKRLKDVEDNILKKIFFLYDQFRKDINLNENLYSDPYNIDNFKNWIRNLFDLKKRNFIGEQYSISNTNNFLGYMSFHYLIRFTNPLFHKKLFDGSMNNLMDINEYYKKYNYIDYFIKFESLNSSLISLFEKIKLPLNKNDLHNTKPINKSNRFTKIDDYYDKETTEMVKHYDALIFKLHKY